MPEKSSPETAGRGQIFRRCTWISAGKENTTWAVWHQEQEQEACLSQVGQRAGRSKLKGVRLRCPTEQAQSRDVFMLSRRSRHRAGDCLCCRNGAGTRQTRKSVLSHGTGIEQTDPCADAAGQHKTDRAGCLCCHREQAQSRPGSSALSKRTGIEQTHVYDATTDQA